MPYAKEEQTSYSFIDLALVLSKQFQVKVSTALEFISLHKNFKESGIIEYKNNEFVANDIPYIEKHLRDPSPPRFS